MTRIIMHGCNGRMGQAITRIAREDDNIEINMKTALLSEVYFGKRKKNDNKK